MNPIMCKNALRNTGIIALASWLVSGCAAGLDGDYSCDKVGGINGCTNMMEVRQLTDSGVFNQPQAQSPAVTTLSGQSTTALPKLASQQQDFIPLPRRDRHGVPLRTSESVQKVTIFPYLNEQGDYVDTSDVYIVVDKSRWTGRPAKYIKQD
ncbi:type IV conjugative transfer system protein TraV (plasmid) [Shewanella baltica OS223]|uniref:type IV conjugative transfer system lipoprotein TraV n=1 Tax=Shewanella baltica TaxID=62322 RepID=UPI0001883F8A|nr:type IV conjugative transfer system lipoprotein TraV [Shewanella baltica]ACK48837.1 type IV conjugative transfer system protein TraV [Shewanella baltica OS223]